MNLSNYSPGTNFSFCFLVLFQAAFKLNKENNHESLLATLSFCFSTVIYSYQLFTRVPKEEVFSADELRHQNI